MTDKLIYTKAFGTHGLFRKEFAFRKIIWRGKAMINEITCETSCLGRDGVQVGEPSSVPVMYLHKAGPEGNDNVASQCYVLENEHVKARP